MLAVIAEAFAIGDHWLHVWWRLLVLDITAGAVLGVLAGVAWLLDRFARAVLRGVPLDRLAREAVRDVLRDALRDRVVRRLADSVVASQRDAAVDRPAAAARPAAGSGPLRLVPPS